MKIRGLVVGVEGVKLKVRLRTGAAPTDSVVDLTTFTNAFFDVRKPNATPGEEGTLQDVEWVAAIELPPTDGYISYTLQAGDLDVKGPYVIQPRIQKAGFVLKGDAVTLEVLDVLTD